MKDELTENVDILTVSSQYIVEFRRNADSQLGCRNRYWMNDVNMCQGSACMIDPTRYSP